jgi:triosephosphate isomerase
MRKPLIAGNWKLFKNPAETTMFFETFRPLVAAVDHCEIVICPPFVDLAAALDAVRDSHIAIGAQNCYWQNEGAFTGEVSAPMLKAAGCTHVIIGHSERRQFFGETDETVFERAKAALAAGLTPIICIGELLAEREAGHTNEVLARQLQGGVLGLDAEHFARVVIAYEPVWAIGTGRTATPEIAQDAHLVIRAQIARQYGSQMADDCRILYGGSVKPGNIAGLMTQNDIDGALVGGASLDPQDFARIVNYREA